MLTVDKYLILHTGLVVLLVFISMGCEKVVYVEVPTDPQTGPRVTVSIYRTSVHYLNGEPYVSVNGKVKNYGPEKITNVKINAVSNYGTFTISRANPSSLEGGIIGDWGVTGLRGTYISEKYATYDWGP